MRDPRFARRAPRRHGTARAGWDGAARGRPRPGGEGFGNLQQSYLEEANVNAVTEISSLIAAQRAYEMNSKVVTAADQMLSTTSQMFRS